MTADRIKITRYRTGKRELFLKNPGAGAQRLQKEIFCPDKHQGASDAMTKRPTWFIITSDEIARIQESLSEIERNLPDHSQERAKEISHIIETVQRRVI